MIAHVRFRREDRLLSISDLSRVELKVFVEETAIGKIAPGRPVEVKIDTFPDKTYPGEVAYVSPQAEFTPKIIQTQKERIGPCWPN